MSEKATCSTCDSHTSAIRRAFHGGSPCPYCKAPAPPEPEIRAVSLGDTIAVYVNGTRRMGVVKAFGNAVGEWVIDVP